MNLGIRLKEERERLKMSQADFAAVADAKKHAQINWEKGATTPNGAAFDAWSKIGVDILYIITGTRSHPVESTLSRREAAMLDNYRHCAEEDQEAIARVALNAAKAKGLAKVGNG